MSASLDDILTTQQQGVVALNALYDVLSAIPGILTPLSPANGGTGVANGALETITLGGTIVTAGNFATSGAFSVTLTATGATNVTLPTTGTLAVVGNPLSQFAATTSAQLAGVISDETGSGLLVFATSPVLTTPNIGAATGASLATTGALTAFSGTAPPAAGAGPVGVKISSTADFGVFVGSGAPTVTAAKGSLYLRTDGSTTNDRMYVASDSAGAWTAVITAT